MTKTTDGRTRSSGRTPRRTRKNAAPAPPSFKKRGHTRSGGSAADGSGAGGTERTERTERDRTGRTRFAGNGSDGWSGSGGSIEARGVLEILPGRGGFLRDPGRSWQPGPDDAWVPQELIRQTGLVEGAFVIGDAASGDRGLRLVSVRSVCGLDPGRFASRVRFDRLTAVNPDERIRLGDTGDASMRIVDLLAPIGKGTRGMIVAPPKSGKTTLLETMAHAVRRVEPAMRLIVLLIDERPEEVTHFRRRVDAEVLASSSDQDVESHARLAEMTLAHVRTELECGRDVFVLVDSLTRMARAFNQRTSGSGRTLSGGLDATALEVPRRFFGLARNVEGGGSVTVVATAMVGTGSRMDDYIFEEFKGTGNSEIVLDRSLADIRLFPAIHVSASGTRRDEQLMTPEEWRGAASLRRRLAGAEPADAIRDLLSRVAQTHDNAELLDKEGSSGGTRMMP
jgi:transcription termination factor Rho